MKIIPFSSFFDDRGELKNIPLYNNFKVKRIYIVINPNKNIVRGFHYHKKEEKIIFCLSGSAKIVVAKKPKKTKYIKKGEEIILNSKNNKGIYIPSNNANGWMSLENNSSILVLSNMSIHESIIDNIKYNPNKYDWSIKAR